MNDLNQCKTYPCRAVLLQDINHLKTIHLDVSDVKIKKTFRHS